VYVQIGDRVRLERLQRFGQELEAGQAGELGVQIMALGGVARAKSDKLEAVDALVGSRVARPHRAESHHQNPHRLCSFAQRPQSPFAFRRRR